jgi:hypothetical protein
MPDVFETALTFNPAAAPALTFSRITELDWKPSPHHGRQDR